MKVEVVRARTIVKEGKEYGPGSILELPDKSAEAQIRRGFAVKTNKSASTKIPDKPKEDVKQDKQQDNKKQNKGNGLKNGPGK